MRTGTKTITRSLKNIPMSRVKTGICGPHHDIRRQVSGDKYKARVLTKAQDDAKLLNIFELVQWEHPQFC